MRFLRAFLVFVRRCRFRTEMEWTTADAKGLQAFMSSHTGRKLQVMLENEVIAANERAAMTRGEAFECGWACGFKGLLAWFEAFQAQSEGSPASSEDADDLENSHP